MKKVQKDNSKKVGNIKIKRTAATEENEKKKPKKINRTSKKTAQKEKKIENENIAEKSKVEVVEGSSAGIPQIAVPNHYRYIASKTNYFIIISLFLIIIFLLSGLFFPSTQDDIINNRVIWAKDEINNFGLFNQLGAAIAFTSGIFALGFYINSTFIKFNMRNWRFFMTGLTAMFIFGLGKIGELVYNHEIFNNINDLALPLALIMMAYSSYKIYIDLNGV